MQSVESKSSSLLLSFCFHWIAYHPLPSSFHREEWWDLQKSKEEGNTGFYFVRSNKRTIKLWADAFAAVPKYVIILCSLIVCFDLLV